MLMSLYSDLWRAYLSVAKGRKIDIQTLGSTLDVIKSIEYSSRPGNIFLIFDSGRLDDKKLLKNVSIRRHRLSGEDLSNSDFFIIDVKTDGLISKRGGLRLNSFIWIVCHLPSFAFGALKGHSLAAGLVLVYRNVFRKHHISKVDLFTSNSRLTELIRIAAITSGLQVTEYLHGICSDVFADYLRLTHRVAVEGQLSYVNMVPRLPQPDVIRRRLLWTGGLEVTFQNEAQWLPYSVAASSDVLIVGGHIPDGDYLGSVFFKNDLSLIDFCLSNGLKVIYSPHPSNFNDARFSVPSDVAIGRFKDYVNSAKVLVGHFSTALFVASLLGKKILLFKDSFSLIPEYFFYELCDRNELRFEEGKLLSILEGDLPVEGRPNSNPRSIGYSLRPDWD